jgi:hypothetical protein
MAVPADAPEWTLPAKREPHKIIQNRGLILCLI